MERIAPFESHGFNSSNGTSLQSSRLKDNFLGFPSTSKTAPLESSLSQNGSLDESITNDSVRYASVLRKGNKMIMVEKSIHTTSASIEDTDIEGTLTNELPQSRKGQKIETNRIDQLSEIMRSNHQNDVNSSKRFVMDPTTLKFRDEAVENEYMMELTQTHHKTINALVGIILFMLLIAIGLWYYSGQKIATYVCVAALVGFVLFLYFLNHLEPIKRYVLKWYFLFSSTIGVVMAAYFVSKDPYIPESILAIYLAFGGFVRYRYEVFWKIALVSAILWPLCMLRFSKPIEFLQLFCYLAISALSTSFYAHFVERQSRKLVSMKMRMRALRDSILRDNLFTERVFSLFFPRSFHSILNSKNGLENIPVRSKGNTTYINIIISKDLCFKTTKTVQDLVDLFCSFGFEVVKEQAEGLLLCEPLNEGNSSIPFDTLLHNLVSYVRTKDFATEFTFNTDQPKVTILIGRGCVVGGVLGTKMKSYDIFGQGIKNIMSVADGELNPGVWVQSDLYHQHFQTPNIEKAADVIVCNQGYEWIRVDKFLEIVKEGTEVAHEGTIHAPLHEDDEGGETNKDFDATQNQQPNKISPRAAKKNLMITGLYGVLFSILAYGWGLLELGMTESMRERNKWIGIYYLVRYGVVGVIALSGILVSVLILPGSIADGSILSQINYIRVIIPYLYMVMVTTKGFLFVTDGGLASKSDPELFFTLSEGIISIGVHLFMCAQYSTIFSSGIMLWMPPWAAIYYYYPGKILTGSKTANLMYFGSLLLLMWICSFLLKKIARRLRQHHKSSKMALLQETKTAANVKRQMDDVLLSVLPVAAHQYYQSSERFEMRHAQHMIVIYSTFSWLHDFNESTQHESHWHFIQEFHHYVELISSYFQVPLMRSIGDRLIFAQITESAEKWPDDIVRCIQLCAQLKSFYDQCMKDGTKSLKSYRICVASGTGLYGFKGSYQISYDVSGQAYTECCHQMKMPKVECIEVSRHIYDVVNQKHLFLTRKEGCDDSSRFFVLGSRGEWARYVSHEFKEHLDNHE